MRAGKVFQANASTGNVALCLGFRVSGMYFLWRNFSHHTQAKVSFFRVSRGSDCRSINKQDLLKHLQNPSNPNAHLLRLPVLVLCSVSKPSRRLPPHRRRMSRCYPQTRATLAAVTFQRRRAAQPARPASSRHRDHSICSSSQACSASHSARHSCSSFAAVVWN